MTALKIVYQSPKTLKPRDRNPRTHSKSQIRQVMRSIEHFGFTNPVLVDEDNRLIAGHGRVEAAKQMGLEQVPTICLSGMSEEDIRAYVIADNKLAENAGWDAGLLALEFQYLDELEIPFDLTLTGFELPEIDLSIQTLKLDGEEGQDPLDQVPIPVGKSPVTRGGDIWHIGPHRLICGDSTDAETYAALLGSERAQMVFTDPPYNVPIQGHVSGLGSVQHREFAMASGEMSPEDFQSFLTSVFQHLASYSDDGSIHFQCMDWRHMREILGAGEVVYSELKHLCVWSKTNGGMGSLYRSQHELVFVFKSGTGKHINNVELGKNGRNRTNVWTYAGANSFGEGQGGLEMHPTVKPVALVRDAILDCSLRGGLVLDPFCGSGSTLIAAEQSSRRGFGIEIDPAYCDVILRRLTDTFGLIPRLGDNGPVFKEVASERENDGASAAAEQEVANV
ncbi:site-specific DNA-methyltransferase [Ruegeria sp.]|uniref:site-specific DNA-methyltransferase n=1 Tax=Ruegeria sp. TaxID=1879320 RepID=UPI003C7E6E19